MRLNDASDVGDRPGFPSITAIRPWWGSSGGIILDDPILSGETRRDDQSPLRRPCFRDVSAVASGAFLPSVWFKIEVGETPAVSDEGALGENSDVNDGAAALPDFAKGDGLLPAIAQDAETGDVLMLAYMNEESFRETVASGRAVYYSRSRNRLWRKGEESGNVQRVSAIYVDCDEDTILLKVEQIGGAACHVGYRSCFYRQWKPEGLEVIAERVFDPAEVYKK